MKPTKGIAVDGSCLGNPGRGEWRAIDLSTGQVLFQSAVYGDATNNIMEFLGLVHAIAYCTKNALELPIYSDSQTGRVWIQKRKCGTNHHTTNSALQQLIERADQWLAKYAPPMIQTWVTREWGQIPSDFGRKP